MVLRIGAFILFYLTSVQMKLNKDGLKRDADGLFLAGTDG